VRGRGEGGVRVPCAASDRPAAIFRRTHVDDRLRLPRRREEGEERRDDAELEVGEFPGPVSDDLRGRGARALRGRCRRGARDGPAASPGRAPRGRAHLVPEGQEGLEPGRGRARLQVPGDVFWLRHHGAGRSGQVPAGRCELWEVARGRRGEEGAGRRGCQGVRAHCQVAEDDSRARASLSRQGRSFLAYDLIRANSPHVAARMPTQGTIRRQNGSGHALLFFPPPSSILGRILPPGHSFRYFGSDFAYPPVAHPKRSEGHSRVIPPRRGWSCRFSSRGRCWRMGDTRAWWGSR